MKHKILKLIVSLIVVIAWLFGGSLSYAGPGELRPSLGLELCPQWGLGMDTYRQSRVLRPLAAGERDYSSRVSELFKKGLDNIGTSYGTHGTSLEAIQYLRQHGRLPSAGRHPGKFYLWPIGEKYMSRKKAIEEARIYSEWNSRKHYILSKLPPNFIAELNENEGAYEELSAYADSPIEGIQEDGALYKLCKKYGIGEMQLNRWCREASKQKRNGIIITISRKIENLGIVVDKLDGVEGFEGIVDVPDGLPIEYITGIEPVGDYEFKVLDKLKHNFATEASILRPLAHGEQPRRKSKIAVEAAVAYLRTGVEDINRFVTQSVRALRDVPHNHYEWRILSRGIWNNYMVLLRGLCDINEVQGIPEFEALKREITSQPPDINKFMEIVGGLFLDNGYLFTLYFGNFFEADVIEDYIPKTRPYRTARIPKMAIRRVYREDDTVMKQDIEGIEVQARVVGFRESVIKECLADLSGASALHVTLREGPLIIFSKARAADTLRLYHEFRDHISETGQLPGGVAFGQDEMRKILKEFLIKAWPDTEFMKYAGKENEDRFIAEHLSDFEQWMTDHEMCHQALNILAAAPEEAEIFTFLRDLMNPRYRWIRFYTIGVQLASGAPLSARHDSALLFITMKLVPELLSQAAPGALQACGISEPERIAAIRTQFVKDPLPVLRILPKLPDDFFNAAYHEKFAKLKQIRYQRQAVNAPPSAGTLRRVESQI